ncbi:MAG: hypothetical protein ACFFBP_15900 [Promethearchaeota archaeon]
MALNPIPDMTLLVPTLTIQLLIGIMLIYKTINSKIRNLLYLALFNLTVGISFLLSRLMVYIESELWAPIFQVLTLTSQLLIVTFIQKTFYKQKKSPYKIVVPLLIGNFFFAFIMQFFTRTLTQLTAIALFIYAISYSIDHAISGYWFAYISLKQYSKYRNMNIEPWIKIRYLLSGIVALAYSNLGMPLFLLVIGRFNPIYLRFFYDLSFLFRAILASSFSLGSLIAWTMPKSFKKFFNKRHFPIEDRDVTEEEIMKEIDHLYGSK